MKIILDNGHGIDTPGKRSPLWSNGTQLFEWKFNRLIVDRIYEALVKKGLKVEKLVPEIFDVPVSVRAARANKIFKRESSSFGVSIHANALTGKPGRANGWEIWTAVGETESDKLAECIYDKSFAHLPFKMRYDRTDGDHDKEKNYYMLYKTIGTFVLSENGFMDNEADCQFMQTNSGLDSIARVHVEGIFEFIKKYR